VIREDVVRYCESVDFAGEGAAGGGAEGEAAAKKKKTAKEASGKEAAKEASAAGLKRKLPEEEYDPTSPTSENSADEAPKKEKAVPDKVPKKEVHYPLSAFNRIFSQKDFLFFFFFVGYVIVGWCVSGETQSPA